MRDGLPTGADELLQQLHRYADRPRKLWGMQRAVSRSGKRLGDVCKWNMRYRLQPRLPPVRRCLRLEREYAVMWSDFVHGLSVQWQRDSNLRWDELRHRLQ